MPDDVQAPRKSNWSGSWSVLRDLEVVCAVIVERKTTGAAHRLGISQPAVSRTIARIEARTGRSLFHREAGRLIPTAHALDLYERSSHIFEALGELDAGDRRADVPTLSILAPPTISALFIDQQVAAFAKLHPELFLSVDVVTLQELPTAIAEGRGDVGMLDADVSHPGVTLEPFIETTAVCLLPEGHPLAEKSHIVPADLNQVEYVGIKRRHTLRSMLDRIFAEAHAEPRLVIETDTALSAAEFVSAGIGVTVLNPFPLMLAPRPGMVVRPFRPAMRFRSTMILPADRPPSAPAREFLDFLKARRNQVLARLPQHD